MRSESRVPQLLLEKLALGELSPEKAKEVEARLAQEEGGEARLARIREENASFPLTHPAREHVPEIRRKAGVKPKKTRSFLTIAGPLVAVAAAFALWMRMPVDDGLHADPATAQGPEITRQKGVPHLAIYRKNGQGTEKLEPGAGVHPRDLLQVAYVPAAAPFGVILSIDGRGGVTMHFPERPGQSQALVKDHEKGNEFTLAHAYELDDAPAFERFFFVTSEAPIDVDAVLAQAKALAQKPADAEQKYLELPSSLHQTSITLRKEP